MTEKNKETISMFGEGYKPVPFDTENLERHMNGVKIAHAHEVLPHGFIQIVFNEQFLDFGELYYTEKINDLRVDTIYAIPNKDNPNIGRIQVNFYRGFEKYD